MLLWRISEFADLDGVGAAEFPGRWNEATYPAVYCSDHPSTSLLEILVHTEREDIPATFQLLQIGTPDSIRTFEPEIPQNWLHQIEQTQRIGTRFLKELEFPLMRIPSIVMPQASNYLFNPSHPGAASIRIVETWRYPFDSRLLA